MGLDEAEGLWGTGDPQQVRDLFPRVPRLIVKDSDTDATVFSGGESYFEPAIPTDVVEAVGAGDAFAAGYLHRHLAEDPPGTCLRTGHERASLTLQTDEDQEALREVSALAAERGKSVGAGTIISTEQITAARRAGAEYLVAPGYDEALIRAAADHSLPFLPGVSTPTEVQAASALGLTWVKAFPAGWLGPQWFSLMKGPFPSMRFVATGGLNAHNAGEFLEAGVRVVAVGSALEDPEQLELMVERLTG